MKWIEMFRLWLIERRKQRNKADFQRIVREDPDLVKEKVLEYANDVAMRILMRTYDREGIHHCWRCPERFGLVKGSGGYTCRNHVPVQHPIKTQTINA